MFDFNDDFDVDFDRLVSELGNSIIDDYDLVEPDRFIPLDDWCREGKGAEDILDTVYREDTDEGWEL